VFQGILLFPIMKRIWEKIEEKMKGIAKDNGFLKT
jgi:hypothetical protein